MQEIPLGTVLEQELEQIRASRRLRSLGEPQAKDPENRLIGLAFSGGGIRSATFNLGVLQALAERRLLRKFDYISTVSGGGFIGSWLMAWLHHQKIGIQEVEKRLSPHSYETERTAEPPEVRFLRNFSNYLTPRKGVFSADFWAFVATYLRNTLLNLAILVLLLLSVLLFPRVIVFLTHLLEVWENSRLEQYGGDILRSQGLALLVGLALGLVGVIFMGLNLCWMDPPKGKKFWPIARPWAIHCFIIAPLFLSTAFLSYALSGLFFWEVVVENESLLAYLAPATGVLIYFGLWFSACLVRWIVMAFAKESRGKGPATWLVLVTAFFAGAIGGLLFLPYSRIITHWPYGWPGGLWHVQTFGTPALVGIMLLAGALHIGLMGRGFTDPCREWWARLGGWLVIYAACWLLLFLMAVYVPFWLGLSSLKYRITLSGALVWVASTLYGVLFGKNAGTRVPQFDATLKQKIAKLAAWVTPYIFIAGLLAGLSVLAVKIVSALTHASSSLSVPPDEAVRPIVVVAWVVSVAAALILSRRVDINAFSMHMLYRNRLVRCYLGASVPGRHEQPFTGFSADDDVLLDSLKISANSADPCDARPIPLLNASLNVSRGKELALQTRKARSFVFSPLFSGYGRPTPGQSRWQWAYARTVESGSARKQEEAQLTLGTAVAISGAAASPNMGFYSTPALAFLMTLFDVRLGWWLGNPRKPQWKIGSPRFGFRWLLLELFGAASDDSGFVYLSDGGHFENLAVYELVRRRCKLIVACDASCDPEHKFGDLHNAMEHCRTDFGVEITRITDRLTLRNHRVSEHFDLCRIRYTPGDESDDGVLIYLKPGLKEGDPEDLLGYSKTNSAYPHDTTANQWFDENHFENYRCLGYRTGLAAASDIANTARPLFS